MALLMRRALLRQLVTRPLSTSGLDKRNSTPHSGFNVNEYFDENGQLLKEIEATEDIKTVLSADQIEEVRERIRQTGRFSMAGSTTVFGCVPVHSSHTAFLSSQSR